MHLLFLLVQIVLRILYGWCVKRELEFYPLMKTYLFRLRPETSCLISRFVNRCFLKMSRCWYRGCTMRIMNVAGQTCGPHKVEGLAKTPTTHTIHTPHSCLNTFTHSRPEEYKSGANNAFCRPFCKKKGQEEKLAGTELFSICLFWGGTQTREA